MNISLQITIDYELFGDGSGNVYREQIIPTNQLMDICEQYNARLTIYFEYGQFLAFEKFAAVDPNLKMANIAIVEQLQEAIKRGHDIQLHLHPTWIDAVYEPQKGFKLDSSKFDITYLKYGQIVENLAKGKFFLENLLRPINKSYRCIAFRSGAWSANDSSKLVSALQETGFKIDSTVAKGAHLNSAYGTFDFREYTNKPCWFVSENLCIEDKITPTILELPILTKISIFSQFYYLSKKRKFVNSIVRNFYKTKLTDRGSSMLSRLVKILSRDFVLADFNFLPSDTIYRMIKSEYNKMKSRDYVIPITLIGHSKTSYLNDDLHLLFKRLNKNVGLKFDTVSSYYKQNIENNNEIIN